jgi:hypothetical protein
MPETTQGPSRAGEFSPANTSGGNGAGGGPAEDLGELAAQINAEHEAGEKFTRKGLEQYRAAGEALIKAREQCGSRKFKPWLEANVKFTRQTAYAYIRVAENWDICKAAHTCATP